MIVSIGTTHPWNIAGVGLDARVAAEYGLGHAMAIAAVSAQDADGVHALESVPPNLLRAQLQSLPAGIRAMRIGALVSSENAAIVAEFVRGSPPVPVIVDPVLAASLGGTLALDDGLASALADTLISQPVIVTPNLAEASQLLNVPVEDVEQMEAAAREFVARGAFAALVKGGHLQGEPVDVLGSGTQVQHFSGTRLAGSMRGSGCTLAAALACELALGRDLTSAVRSAREYVRTKISAGAVRAGLQVAF